MRTSVLVVFAVSVILLGGCLGDTPKAASHEPAKAGGVKKVDLSDYSKSRPLSSLKEIKPFVATARDGVKLKGHVYIPDGPGPFGTVLEYSPYHNGQNNPSDKQEQTVQGRRTMRGGMQAFMDAGFAVALVNLRGTGQSGSCFHWGAQIDVDDVTLVIDTLAAMPHSNGNVGMVGTSWPGWTQYLALAGGSEHLKAVIPVSGVIDGYSVLARNGAPLSVGPAAETLWNVQYSLGEATYLPVDSRGGETNHLDCGPRYGEDAKESAELITNGDRTPYWNARDLRPKLGKSTAPILFTNGLTDGEGHILQFEGLWDLLHQEKRMMIGQWGHGGTAHPSGDWVQMRVAWFDHYLRGGPPLLETGIVEYQDDLKAWHTSDRWPPQHEDVTLFVSDKTLVETKDAVKASTQVFQSIHANPCLGVCTKGLVDTPNFAVCGPFQAVYVSPPLKEDVLLAGNFHVNLTLASSLPDGNLGAFLYRTKGPGVCPDENALEVRRAITDLRHARETGAWKGADFPINSPTTVNLAGHPFASQIKAGERLVLVVGGGSLELVPDPRQPVLTVSTGPSLVGQITLPVVEGELAFQ
jgi:uncharacterized protein